MFNQHAKWLKITKALPWRRDIASLNYLLTSHVRQQDQTGFTHQDHGFLDHVVNKKADVVRVYLPPDANTLLSVMDHCLRSRNYVNVVVAGKRAMPQWLSMEAAVVHCTEGAGIWQWASNDQGTEPDVVLACAGDTPTMEVLAAVSILREHLPQLKVRVVNVVDLMKLQPESEHPHGLNDADYDTLFTRDKHVIFAFHGYPQLIHRLTDRRTNRTLRVRGYNEEGTITPPSTCASRTAWTASTWSWTSSTGFLRSAPAATTSSSRCRTGLSSTRATSTPTARTSPRSATGSGPEPPTRDPATPGPSNSKPGRPANCPQRSRRSGMTLIVMRDRAGHHLPERLDRAHATTCHNPPPGNGKSSHTMTNLFASSSIKGTTGALAK